jgi:hypothetical protein
MKNLPVSFDDRVYELSLKWKQDKSIDFDYAYVDILADYFLEMDWEYKQFLIDIRLYNDVQERYLGKLEEKRKLKEEKEKEEKRKLEEERLRNAGNLAISVDFGGRK